MSESWREEGEGGREERIKEEGGREERLGGRMKRKGKRVRVHG